MIIDILVVATYIGLVYLMGKSHSDIRSTRANERVETKDKFKA